MNLLKRITTTINATMNDVVGRVEDHDAIIDASLQQCRQAAARTRTRLTKVKRDGAQLQSKRDKLAEDITLWTERAIDNAEADEEIALNCLKRKKWAETERTRLEGMILEHTEIESSLQSRLEQIEARIRDINLKRNSMRSRQSLSEAMQIMDKMDGDSGSTVDDTFERWETVLLERELFTNEECTRDRFEMEFVEKEERESLLDELKSLSEKPRGKNDE